ncbi:MAG: hypothetical protein ABIG10_03540 [bacterium]
MGNFFLELFSLSPWQAVYRIMFWYFGFLPLGVLFIGGAVLIWRKYRRIKWYNKQKFILLAIDIPENNIQSCRAVENLFTYLAGADKNINLIEKWWEGIYQLAFSMEIVGIDGYIQFLIRTPAHFKNLVETAIYANYPDAEITEVEDYTRDAPTRFPNEEYDCWGGEFILAQNHMLPIKLYREFEHQFGPLDTTYRDPMASLMDLLSSLQKGEQLWWQIIVIPTGFEWMKEGHAQIDKIAGIKSTVKESMAIKALGAAGKVAGDLGYIVAAGLDPSREPGEFKPDDKQEVAEFNMLRLTPDKKKKIEGIQEKISKMGFEIKIRMVYLAKKDVINKPKAVNGFVGFIKQFTANDLNGFKPDMDVTATSAAYFMAQKRMDIRKNRIVNNYKNRDEWAGRRPFIMNSEELATLWHFPVDTVVKAPLVQRAAAKRMEAPMSLPTGEQQVDMAAPEPIFEEGYEIKDEQSAQPAGQGAFEPVGENGDDTPPENLPFV